MPYRSINALLLALVLTGRAHPERIDRAATRIRPNFKPQTSNLPTSNLPIAMIVADITRQIYRTYVEGTGLDLPLSQARNHALERLIAAGHTRADLAALIAYLKREIRDGKRNEGALKFSNLIDADNGFERFEEDLALARKFFRPRLAARTESLQVGPTTIAVDREPAADSDAPPINEPLSDELAALAAKLRGGAQP